MDRSRMQWMLKLIWRTIAVALALGVLVSAIVNYAISRELTWAWFVIGASVLTLGIVTPLVFGGKHRLLLTLLVLALLIMPFLMLAEYLSSTGPWAWSVGFPIAAISLAVLLIGAILFQYTRINNWYCGGIAVLAALPINPVANYVISKRFDIDMPIANMVINMIGALAIGIALLYIGTVKKRQQAKSR